MRVLVGMNGTVGAAQRQHETASAEQDHPAQQLERQLRADEPILWPRAERFIGLPSEELRRIDPVVLNLAVAKGIRSQATLDIARYVRLADQWAAEIRGYLPSCDANFYKTPERWNNDLDFSRLAMIGWYVGKVLKIAYREDQKNLKAVLYTDPSDLFLNGVMDARRGTCGNMALLWVVLAQRLGWPVSLATVGPHFICRVDDGKKVINIEASDTTDGDWSSPPDRYYLQERGERSIPQRAVDCGSDLRALTPREMLGVFFGLRARHLENVNCLREAEPDYLVARYLFPRNRQLYINQNQVSVQNSMELFVPGEKGHPIELAYWLREVVSKAPWSPKMPGATVLSPNQCLPTVSRGPSLPNSKEKQNASHAVDAVFQAMCRKPK
jgi:hypothetical protein